MSGSRWSESETIKLKKLLEKGVSPRVIAQQFNRSYNSITNKIYKGLPVPPSTMPVWDKPLKSTGDALILSDIEAPFQHSEFINKVLDVAYKWRITDLHLAGDLLHYDNLSAWGSEWTADLEYISDELFEFMNKLKGKMREEGMAKLEEIGAGNNGGLSGELKEARRVFKSFNFFTNIFVALGNHDDRYIRALNQALSPQELLHQLDVHTDERYKIAPYYYTLIETDKGTFRATHPRGSAKNTAIDLAVQFHQHIIMGHSHRWSVNLDPSGQYWAIQTGCCVDERRLAYVGQRDSKRDAHTNGATIIRGGYPFVFHPDSPFEMFKRM